MRRISNVVTATTGKELGELFDSTVVPNDK